MTAKSTDFRAITLADRRLRWCLTDIDPFWVRWSYFCEMLCITSASGVDHGSWVHTNCQDNPTPTALQQCILLVHDAFHQELVYRGSGFGDRNRARLISDGLIEESDGVMRITTMGTLYAQKLKLAEEKRVGTVPIKI